MVVARSAAWLAFVALLACPQRAVAACMSDGRPLCQLYEQYGVVFDGTVIGIENLDDQESISRQLEAIPHRVATFAVHRSWKGVSGERVQLLMRGGLMRNGVMVGVSEELSLRRGERYVIFGSFGPAGYVEASACSPSVRYRAAVEALEFLYSLDRPPSGGVITGYVWNAWRSLRPGTEKPSAGVTRMTISRADVQRTFEIKEGRFEFGGLQPGDYSVSITRPAGMMQETTPRTVTIATLRSCENLMLNNIPDTRITGFVTSTDGKPIDAMRVDLADADNWELDSASTASAYMDEGGFFRFEGIPPGRYVVGINLQDVPTQSMPHARSIYQDGMEPLRVTIDSGQTSDLGALRLGPALSDVPILLELVWWNGLPVSTRTVAIEDATGGLAKHARIVESTPTDQVGKLDFVGRASRTYVAAIWSHEGNNRRRLTVTEPFRAESALTRLRVVLPRPIIR